MQRNGWTLLFHDCVIEQLQRLHAAAPRAEAKDPKGHADNGNVKLLRVLSHLILDVVPNDPANEAYRQGNTLGSAYRHWRRAKIGRRFRLFFRYDAKAKIIVFAWVNDERTLRSAGSKSDRRPGDWQEFFAQADAAEVPDDFLAERDDTPPPSRPELDALLGDDKTP